MAVISHDSPPKGYPKSKKQYGDPANYKYPLDTAAHVRAAWSYLNMPRNRKGYSSSQLAAIESRIRAAAKRFGVSIGD